MSNYRASITLHQPRIASEFASTFSRFEFALKHGGFLRGHVGTSADADWDRFGQTLGAKFFTDLRNSPQAKIFFEAPPKKLIVIGNDLPGFVEPEAIDNTSKLLVAVRRVRNNLFHGDKSHFQQRDYDLVTASLFVLDAAFAAAEASLACQRMVNAFVFAPVAGQ